MKSKWNIVSLNLCVLSLMIFLGSCTTSTQQVEVVSASQFKTYLEQNPKALVLDVRTPEEFDSTHITNAVHINFEAENFQDRLKSAVDTTDFVLLHCRTGNKSSQTSVILQGYGVDTIIELDGGFEAWQQKFRP